MKYIFVLLFLLSVSTAYSAPTINIKPATQNVNPGQKATVKITSTNSTLCTVTGDIYNKNKIELNGSVLLDPTKTVDYLFTCTDATGNISTTTAKVVVLNRTTQTGTQTTTQSNNQTNAVSNSGSQTPKISYSNDNVLKEAFNICNEYTGFKSVYDPATAISGVSSVPTDLTQLRPVLEAINKNTQLTANELRAADQIRFCRVLPNVANASNKLAEETAKNLKTFADKCYADRPCFLKRAYEADLARELDYTKGIGSEEIAKSVQGLVVKLTNKNRDTNPKYDYKLNKYCNEQFQKQRTPIVCISAPHDEEIVKETVLTSIDRINSSKQQLDLEFRAGGGIIGSRPCIKTYSGSDPTNVFYKDRDCADHKEEPAIINQEVLRQIAALPYTQAYSPAAELGSDQAINNINTRIRSGNLVDPDISLGFGSVAGGGANPLTGGGTNSGTDLKSVEPNYNKLIANVKVITTLYDVAKEAYASTTSVCKVLPVEARAKVIENIDKVNKPYKDYSKALTTVWTAAKKKPKENYLPLVTQINFDLKDKYNQQFIDKVYDAVKALLQTCVDASAKAGT